MIDIQVRHYKTLPEFRRVLRALTDSVTADTSKLATIRRALNISCLTNMFSTVAAPIKKGGHPAVEDEDISDLGPKYSSMVRNSKALQAPVKKGKTSVPVKPSKAKPVLKGKAKPVVDEEDDDSEDVAPSSSIDDVVRTRGKGGKGKAAEPEAKPLTPAVMKQINGLSDLLRQRHERMQIAEHVKQSLSTHYTNDDSIVNRMLVDADNLIKNSKVLFHETRKTLHKLGYTHFPSRFNAVVENVEVAIQKQFADHYESFDTSYAVCSGTYGKDKAPATFFIAYLTLHDLRGPKSTQDYIITLTEVQSIGLSKQSTKEADSVLPRGKNRKQAAIVENAKPKAVVQNYVRTFDSYRAPTSIASGHLGTAFSFDADAAMRLILGTMKLDKMIDVLHPVAIPIKTTELNFTHDAIDSAKINRDSGVLRIYLKKNVNEAKAKAIYQAVYLDVRKIIEINHPKYRNPIVADLPKQITMKVKTKDGMAEQKRFVIDFKFEKPSDGAFTDIPRDVLNDMVKKMDLDPDQGVAFQRMFKQFHGMPR